MTSQAIQLEASLQSITAKLETESATCSDARFFTLITVRDRIIRELEALNQNH